jgi:succinyl-diaminopimelate desuccinylase
MRRARAAGVGVSATVELARALVRVPTALADGNELAAAEVVAAALDVPWIERTVQRLDGGRGNLVARLRGRGDAPTLVLCGHLDTVPVGDEPWSVDPLGGAVRDGRLWGRGAADMKGAIAAMTAAMRELTTSERPLAGDLVLALTAGEETDSCGARAMVESGAIADAGMLIIGEMTGLTVGCGHKGLMWVAVDTTGRRGHGSVVGRDGNALARLVDWLAPVEALDRLVEGAHPLLGCGSVSLNELQGGDAPNVVPGAARAVLDIRTLPIHDHAAILSTLRARDENATVSVLREGSPIITDSDDALVQACAAAVNAELGEPATLRGLPYLTDASVFADAMGDAAIVILGPGEESAAHGVDESVPVVGLEQATRIYHQIAERLLLR